MRAPSGVSEAEGRESEIVESRSEAAAGRFFGSFGLDWD